MTSLNVVTEVTEVNEVIEVQTTNLQEENTMNNVTTLEAKRAEMKAVIEAKMKAAREKAELDLLSNEAFQEAIVGQAIRQDATDKLVNLGNQCDAIVSGMEIYSKTLKKARTWNPSKRYGFGNQFAELSGLLSGIQYSVQEHAVQMLAVTGLSSDLIERTLNAMGSLTYFSNNYNEVVVGTPTNVPELLTCVQLIEYQLGVTIDKSLITQEVADRQYYASTVKAEGAKAESGLTLNLEHAIIR